MKHGDQNMSAHVTAALELNPSSRTYRMIYFTTVSLYQPVKSALQLLRLV